MKLVLEDDYEDLLKDIRKARLLYIGLFLSIPAQLVPNGTIMLISAVAFLLLVWWAMRLKRSQGKDSFLGGHAAYLMVTLRVFFYIALIGMVGGYMFLQKEITPTEMEVFTRMLISAMMGGDQLPQAFGYIFDKHSVATSLFVGFGFVLPLAYLTYRFVKGALSAFKGEMVKKPAVPFL